MRAPSGYALQIRSLRFPWPRKPLRARAEWSRRRPHRRQAEAEKASRPIDGDRSHSASMKSFTALSTTRADRHNVARCPLGKFA